jgi:hypothetical protein
MGGCPSAALRLLEIDKGAVHATADKKAFG